MRQVTFQVSLPTAIYLGVTSALFLPLAMSVALLMYSSGRYDDRVESLQTINAELLARVEECEKLNAAQKTSLFRLISNENVLWEERSELIAQLRKLRADR